MISRCRCRCNPTPTPPHCLNIFTSSHFPMASLAFLPTELLLIITDELPISSKAALQLTCRTILFKLGCNTFQALSQNSDERKAFLAFLDRDLPDYYSGYGDQVGSGPILRKRIPEALPQNWGRCEFLKYSGTEPAGNRLNFPACDLKYSVHWPHLVLALKRHSLGEPHGIPLEGFKFAATLAFCQKVTLDDTLWFPPTELPLKRYLHFRVVPRIVAGHLLLRVEYEICFPELQVAHFQDLMGLPSIKICNHTATTMGTRVGHDNRLAQLTWPNDYRYGDDEEQIERTFRIFNIDIGF